MKLNPDKEGRVFAIFLRAHGNSFNKEHSMCILWIFKKALEKWIEKDVSRIGIFQ